MKKVTALKSNDKKEIFAVILNDEGVKMELYEAHKKIHSNNLYTDNNSICSYVY